MILLSSAVPVLTYFTLHTSYFTLLLEISYDLRHANL